MALLEDLVCSECEKPFKGVRTKNYPGDLCNECREAKEKEEKDAWLGNLRDGKTIEERIAWVEEYIYDHQNDMDRFHPDEIIG